MDSATWGSLMTKSQAREIEILEELALTHDSYCTDRQSAIKINMISRLEAFVESLAT